MNFHDHEYVEISWNQRKELILGETNFRRSSLVAADL